MDTFDQFLDSDETWESFSGSSDLSVQRTPIDIRTATPPAEQREDPFDTFLDSDKPWGEVAKTITKPEFADLPEGVGRPISTITGKPVPTAEERLNLTGSWEDKYNIPGGLKDVGKLLYDIPINTMGAVASLFEDDNPEAEYDWKDIAIKAQSERNKERMAEAGGEEYVLPWVQRKNIREAAASSGFSAVAMGAGGVGYLAGVPTPIPGTGPAMALAASGSVAHKMDKAMFTQQIIEAARQNKPDITPEEVAKLIEDTKEIRSKHALWEAIPEAAGNVAQLTGIGVLFKAALGKKLGAKIFQTLAGMYGAEISTETITQMGQHNAEIEAGIATGKERSFTSLEDLKKSLKEVGPQTFVLVSLTGGAGAVGAKTYQLTTVKLPDTGKPIIKPEIPKEPEVLKPGIDLELPPIDILRTKFESGEIKLKDLEAIKEIWSDKAEVAAEIDKIVKPVEEIKEAQKVAKPEEIKPIPEQIVEQVNKDLPDSPVKYDGIQEGFGDIPESYQFTIQGGIAKGATFNVRSLEPEAIKAELNKMIELREKVKTTPAEPTPAPVKATEPAAKAIPKGKEPWEMTKDEWLVNVGYKKSQGSRVRKNWLGTHEGEVRIASQNRKPIPTEVLAEYPDLKPAAPPQPIAQKPPEAAGEAIEGKKEAKAQEPAPKPEATVEATTKAKVSKIRTLRGRIKEEGGINFLNFKGELKNLPTAVKYLSKKTGRPIDMLEQTLKDEGWLYKDESLLDILRDPRVLSRDLVGREVGEKKVYELTPEERKFKKEMEYEPEDPPKGEYKTISAEDLPVGKKLTLIENKSKRGWDIYEVTEKDPFSVTLKDGEIIELMPKDQVEILATDLVKTSKPFEAVAIRANDGTIYKGKRGEIHIDVMERIPFSKKKGITYEDQGFIDNKGGFYTRAEASIMVGEFEAKMMKAKGLMPEKEKALSADELQKQDKIRLKSHGIGQGRSWEYRDKKGTYRVALTKEEAVQMANEAVLAKPKVEVEIIPFSKELDIRNLDALPRGTGAKYLEVIKGEGNEYIAKQWRRKPTEEGILVDFEPKDLTKSEEELYATTEKPSLSDLTLEAIESLPFTKKGKVLQFDDGSFAVALSDKRGFFLKSVDSITPNEISLKANYGRSELIKGERVVGSYTHKDKMVKIVKGIGDKWTLTHEFEHFLEKSGLLTPREVAAIERQSVAYNKGTYTGAEGRARFVVHELQAREKVRGSFIGKTIQKIQDILDGFVNLFTQTTKGAIRAIESGKAALREGVEVKGEGVPLYATKEGLTEKQRVLLQKHFPEILTGKKEPEIKESKLAIRTEADAIEAKLTEDFGDLVEYKTISGFMKDQAERFAKVMDADYTQAKRMAMGEIKPPEPIREATAYEGVKIRAIREGDVETLQKLATESTVPTRLSEYGQAIKAADSRIMEDPVKVMQDVKKIRAEVTEKTTGKSTEKQDAEIARLNKELEETKKALDEHIAKKEAISQVDAIDELIEPKAPIPKKQAPKAKYGSKNKIITQVEYEKVKAELRKQFATQLSVGLDPTILAKLSKVGGYHFEAGTRAFGEWSGRVIEDVGDWVKPHLAELWKHTKPAFSTEVVKSLSSKIDTALTKGKDLPGVSLKVQELAKHFVEMGVKDRAALVTAVHDVLKKTIPDITRRETMDAISGYGKYKLLSKEEVMVELRDLKGQMQQVAKLEDLESRKPPLKTGIERRTPSDEERQLIKQVEAAKRKYGIQVIDKETQLKSSLDAIKTRLTNQITDLETQIASRQKIVKEKTGVTYDAEATRLKTKRNELKKEFDKIFGKTKMTEAQRMVLAFNAVKKSIAEYTRKIAEKDLTPFAKKSPLHSAELDKLRTEREGLRNQLQELRDIANPKKTPEQIALQSLKTRLKNETQKFSDKLKTLDFSKKEKRVTILDAEAQKLKKEHERAKENYNAAAQATGIITKEEATNIVKLSQATSDARTIWEAKLKENEGNIRDYLKTHPKEKTQYGATKRAYQNYVDTLSGINAPIKTLLKNRAMEAKTTWIENRAKAVYDVFTDSLRTILDNSVALVGSWDNSFLGRQGLFTFATHPTKWWSGAKSSLTAIRKELGGKDALDAIWADIYSMPRYMNGEYQKSGLLSMKEEAIPSLLPERLPVLGRVFKASNSAFFASGLKMRLGVYDLLADMQVKNGVEMLGNNKQAEGLGTLINSLTYRGKWGKAGVSPWVKLVIWAPNIIKAQYDILTAHTGGAGLPTAFARQQAWINLGKIVAEAVAIAFIANAISPGSAEPDPRSSAFGKIKIGPDQYIDYTAGTGSMITFVARITTGTTKNMKTGRKTELTRFGASGWDAATNFIGNKFNPPAGVIRDKLRGRFFGGEKFSWMGAWYRAQTPISVQQAVELKDKPLTIPRAIGLGGEVVGFNYMEINGKKRRSDLPSLSSYQQQGPINLREAIRRSKQ